MKIFRAIAAVAILMGWLAGALVPEDLLTVFFLFTLLDLRITKMRIHFQAEILDKAVTVGYPMANRVKTGRAAKLFFVPTIRFPH